MGGGEEPWSWSSEDAGQDKSHRKAGKKSRFLLCEGEMREGCCGQQTLQWGRKEKLLCYLTSPGGSGVRGGACPPRADSQQAPMSQLMRNQTAAEGQPAANSQDQMSRGGRGRESGGGAGSGSQQGGQTPPGVKGSLNTSITTERMESHSPSDPRPSERLSLPARAAPRKQRRRHQQRQSGVGRPPLLKACGSMSPS